MKNIPGKRWIIFLGVAGFAAGFIGPMIFSPEANQGPLVGIFISGPAGVLLGLALYTLCTLLKISTTNQWRLLLGTATIGVIATLIFVQPSPALQGNLFDAEVISCSSPIDVEAETLKYWEQRVAAVTWASPRTGWQQDMHRTSQAAPGIVIELQLTRVNFVYKNRKPWNRGSFFAKRWRDASEKKSFYVADGSCEEYPIEHQLHGFQPYNLGGEIEAPTAWPPVELKDFINASTFITVPERFKTFQ